MPSSAVDKYLAGYPPHLILQVRQLLEQQQLANVLRAKYPHAQIILTTTILGHDAAWDRAIDEVCRELSKTDGRVHHFLYSKNGCGTPG